MTKVALGSSGATPQRTREHKGKSLYEWVDNYVAVLLKTNGLIASHSEIIEFAAIKIINGMIASEFKCLVKPNFPVSKTTTKKTGITNMMLEMAPSISGVLPIFLTFAKKEIIVVHNANFVINFIYDTCVSQNSKIVFDNDFIDIMLLSRRLFPLEDSHSMVDVARRFGYTIEEEHRAMPYALKVHKCYEYMKQYAAANKNSPYRGPRVSDITNKKFFNDMILENKQAG